MIMKDATPLTPIAQELNYIDKHDHSLSCVIPEDQKNNTTQRCTCCKRRQFTAAIQELATVSSTSLILTTYAIGI